MRIEDILLLNLNILLTPILIYLVYISYIKIQDKEEEKLILIIIIFLQVYLIFKYSISLNKNFPLLIIDIPLLISYYKKENTLIILLSIINIVYYNTFYNTLALLIAEYIIYFFINKKDIKYYWIIKILFLTYYTNQTIEIIYNILPSIIFFSLIVYLLKKAEEMLNLHQVIKQITKEKQIKDSLFKITHEIKNPIAVCKGYLDMYDEKKEECKNYIPIIKEEIDRVLVLLEDFLSMNRQKITKEIIDINLLLEETITNMKLLFKNKKIKLETKIIDDEIYINADYNRLTQVLVNILKNSVEALDNKKSPTIKVWTEKNKNKIKIHIKDNGIGIKKENITKINEPFFTTKQKGTGLGVSLSNEIVKAHKGKVKYISKENEFTEVIVTLPLEKAI